MAFLTDAMDLRGLDYLSEWVGAEDYLAFLMLFQIPWKRSKSARSCEAESELYIEDEFIFLLIFNWSYLFYA